MESIIAVTAIAVDKHCSGDCRGWLPVPEWFLWLMVVEIIVFVVMVIAVDNRWLLEVDADYPIIFIYWAPLTQKHGGGDHVKKLFVS